MARKKKDPRPVADEPSATLPPTEDAELTELAGLAGEAPQDSTTEDPAPQNDPTDESDAEADSEPEDAATQDADEPLAEDDDVLVEDAPVAADDAGPAEETPVADEDEPAEDEPTEDELTEDEPSQDDDVVATLDGPQAPFDDDLELPWIEDELAEDSGNASGYTAIPVSPASPADTTYPPPPPYDPNIRLKAGRKSARAAAAEDTAPLTGGADYMLADAMGHQTKKRSRTPLLVGAAVLVLALIGGIIWAAPTLFPAAFAPARNSTPKAAVEGYLKALASGDSTAALTAAVAPPAETALLTDEVLKSSQQRAPIADIVVKDATGSSSVTVPATYTLGGKPVTANFPTQKVGNEWRLVTITRDVQLTGIDNVALTLNGIPVTDTAHLTLFPGSYALASANDRLALAGGEFTVQSPSDFANPTLSATISDKGMADARAAAQSFLNACVKKKEIIPSGCGIGVSAAGVKVKSVTWEITSGAKTLKTARFKIESSQPYIASVYPYIQLKATVFDNGGRRYTGVDSITVAKVDLAGPDVKVTFNS